MTIRNLDRKKLSMCNLDKKNTFVIFFPENYAMCYLDKEKYIYGQFRYKKYVGNFKKHNKFSIFLFFFYKNVFSKLIP